MNITDVLFSKYSVIEIPNMGRDEMALLFHELDFTSGAEIGVERGYYSETLCKANPQATIYGVDPWESLETSKNNPPQKTTQNHSPQKRLDRFYEETKVRLSRYPHYHIVKKYSIDAARDFQNDSLDFVYIDANHSYFSVRDDITIWIKKVKPNGIIAGHDYYNTDAVESRESRVQMAVDDYVSNHDIKPLIIAAKDKWKSWMFVKP